jgi:hypothetical protein
MDSSGSLAVTCECGNERSGYVKCWEFLDYPRAALLLKDSAPCSKEVMNAFTCRFDELCSYIAEKIISMGPVAF